MFLRNSISCSSAEDVNYTYLYFTYNLSPETVTIQGANVIPEFPSFLILLTKVVDKARVKGQ